MNYYAILIAFIVSFTICTVFIRMKWRFYKNSWPFSNYSLLKQHNVLSGVWPVDEGFMSLIYSALRHTVIPVIFSALIWFVNVEQLHSAATFLCLLYIWSPFARYRTRRKDYKSSGDASQKLLKPVKSACFSVVMLSVVNYLILFVCYCFRP